MPTTVQQAINRKAHEKLAAELRVRFPNPEFIPEKGTDAHMAWFYHWHGLVEVRSDDCVCSDPYQISIRSCETPCRCETGEWHAHCYRCGGRMADVPLMGDLDSPLWFIGGPIEW